MKLIIVFLLVYFFASNMQAQTLFIPKEIKCRIDSLHQKEILASLNDLLDQIQAEKIDDAFVHSKNTVLTVAMLEELKDLEHLDNENFKDYYQKQLINLYPLDFGRYGVSFAYVGPQNDSTAVLKMIFNLVAEKENGVFKFAIPLDHFIQDWKEKTIGNITYFYRDEMNVERAKIFDKKNTLIAEKLGVTPEKLKFYLCKNYQEILAFFGFQYDLDSNGKGRHGHGVQNNCIFSIQHNEDFSHDVFHYYSGKINERANRNWVTEEGIAYLWGNAYWTNPQGEMISQDDLVEALKVYLQKNPEVQLLDLFVNETKIFNDIALEVSVTSTISGIICREVERQKGSVGISQLINCGRKPTKKAAYFEAIDQLLSINKANFNEKVGQLLNQWQANSYKL